MCGELRVSEVLPLLLELEPGRRILSAEVEVEEAEPEASGVAATSPAEGVTVAESAG